MSAQGDDDGYDEEGEDDEEVDNDIELHVCTKWWEEIIFWSGRCDYEGHNEVVHDAEDFKQVGNKMFWHFPSATPQQTLSNVRCESNFGQQRRAVVDTLGWEPFQNWFYDQTFRGWWQVGFLTLGQIKFGENKMPFSLR